MMIFRDLKPENILYSTPADDAILKLADFGLANMLGPDESMNVACGTPGYVAPEILKHQPYGKEVDIWSIGIILYILLCGFPPFYDDNNKKLFAMIVNAKYDFPDPYWTDVSQLAKDLVIQLLKVNPSERLTASEILQHPWMTTDAPRYHLTHFQSNLKSYNMKRRFRTAIRTVQATNFIKNVAINSLSFNHHHNDTLTHSTTTTTTTNVVAPDNIVIVPDTVLVKLSPRQHN